jgi:hypothetical protein
MQEKRHRYIDIYIYHDKILLSKWSSYIPLSLLFTISIYSLTFKICQDDTVMMITEITEVKAEENPWTSASHRWSEASSDSRVAHEPWKNTWNEVVDDTDMIITKKRKILSNSRGFFYQVWVSIFLTFTWVFTIASITFSNSAYIRAKYSSSWSKSFL